MASLRVAGGHGRQTSCLDARQIQRVNQQAEVLFGEEHVLEPNFAAPMLVPEAYEHPDEEKLLVSSTPCASPPASLLGTTTCRKVQYLITHLNNDDKPGEKKNYCCVDTFVINTITYLQLRKSSRVRRRRRRRRSG